MFFSCTDDKGKQQQIGGLLNNEKYFVEPKITTKLKKHTL